MCKNPAEGKNDCGKRRILSGKCLMAVLMVAVMAVSCFVILNGSNESEAANSPDRVFVANTYGGPVEEIQIGNTVEYSEGEKAGYYNGYEKDGKNYSGGVLVLTNFRGTMYDGTHVENGKSACIYANGSITIVLEGENSDYILFSGGNNGCSSNYGIYVNGDLTIVSHTLSDTEIEFIDVNEHSSTESAGIYCSGKLTVINESNHYFRLYARGDTQSFDDGSDKSSYATYGIKCGSAVFGSDTNNNRLAVSGIGGDITTAPNTGTVHSIGIYSYNGGIDIKGNTEITGDGVRHSIKGAVGGSINISGYTNGANPVISAGIYSVTAFSYNPTNANRFIESIGGDIFMNLNTSTYGDGGISYGIYAGSMSASGTITATGGKVPLGLPAGTSNSYGIWTTSFTGDHATITATASDATRVSCGFLSTGGFDTGEGSTITCNGGAAPSNIDGTFSAGLRCADYTGRAGSDVTGTGGTACYIYTSSVGVRASTILMEGDAKLTGVGGNTCKTYRPTQYANSSNTVVTGDATDTYGIYIDGNTVELEDDSILTGTGGTITTIRTANGGSWITAGVFIAYSAQDLTISGSGHINANGGNVAYSTDTKVWNISAGLYTVRPVIIDGTYLEVTGGTVCTESDASNDAYKGSRSYGLYAASLTVANGAVISAEGGANGCYSTTEGSSPKYNDSIGIYVTSGNLSVSGGSSITATGKGSQRIIGIIVNGNVTVNGGSTITVNVPANVSQGYITNFDGIGKASIGIYLSNDTSSFSVPSGTVILTGTTQAIRCTGGNTETFSSVEALWTSDSLTGEGAEIIASSTNIADVSSVYVKMDNTFSVMFGGGWVYGDEPSALEFSNPGRVVSKIYTGTDVFGSTYYSDASPPTNAGDYTVTIRYDGDNVKSFDFSITPRAGGTIAVSFNPTPRYTGSVVVPEITKVTRTENGDTTELDFREYQVTNIDPAAIPASLEKFYNATVVLNKNYQGSKQISYRIITVFPETSMFNIPEVGSVGYTGEPVEVSAPTLKSPMEGCGSITVKYARSTEPPTAVGSYDVTFDVSGGSNIQARTNLPIGTLVITPYTVSFDRNGGDGTMANVTNIAGAYALPNCGFTAPAGKVFSKWAAGSAGGTQYAEGYEYNVVSDITFYAVWEDIVYDITFQSNGGTGDMETVNKTYGQTYELPSNGFTAPAHKEFKCWLIGETEYPVGEEITIESDVTVKAVWRYITYTVTASINGGYGTVSRPSQTVNSGDDALEITFTAGDHRAIASYYLFPGNTSIPSRPSEWSYTATNVTKDVDIIVYTIEYFDITLTGMTGCTLTTNEEHGYAFYGESYTFDFALNDGYDKGAEFAVKVNGETVELTNDNYTITNVRAAKSVTVAGVVPIEYTIIYDLDGGAASNPGTYTVESSDIVLNNPTKAGHTFEGWTGTGLNSPTDSVTIAHGSTGNRTYTATWEPIKYTVIWKSQDGTETLETDLNVPYGTKPSYNVSAPTKDRTDQYTYTFAGWALTADQESGTAAGDLSTVSGDVTYYAAFSKTINRYTATFNLNGGSPVSLPIGWTGSEGVYTKDFDYGTIKASVIADFGDYTKTGYSVNTVTSTADTMGASGMTLTVEWRINNHNVTLRLEGGSLAHIPTGWMFHEALYYKTFAYGTPYSEIIASLLYDSHSIAPTKTGYTFTGWDPSTGTLGDAPALLTATYSINSYTVMLDLGGGTLANIPTGWEFNVAYTKSFEYKTPYSEIIASIVYDSNPIVPTKAGYTFARWEPNAGTLGAGNATLTAIYNVNQYTATFNLNGGSPVSPPIGWTGSEGVYTKDFDYGTAKANIIDDFGAYVREGYTKGAETSTADTVGTGGITIDVNWTEHSLTVTFMGNGNTSGSMQPQIVRYSDDVKTLASNTFVKSRNHFIGWNTTIGGTGTSYAAGANVAALITSPTSALTLYAQWEADPQYTVTFNSNGGTTVDPQLVYKGECAVRPLTPEKEIYVFGGWFTDNDTFENAYVFENTPVNGNITLYAKWDNHQHNLQHHEAVSPTCTESGTIEYWQCTVCGDYFSDSEGTSRIDAIEDPAFGHAWGDWEVTTPSTCTEIGTETRYCTRDHDHFESRILAMIRHDVVAVEYQAATCTESGHLAHWRCTACGTLFSDDEGNDEITALDVEIAALGHDLNHHDAQAPTCTEHGWVAYDACSRCSYSTYAEIPALGHDLTHHDAVPADCTHSGMQAYDTCSRCDYVSPHDVIPALGHDYDVVVTAPTCTEQGYTTHTCSRCHDSYVDSQTDALGHDLTHHDAVPADCTQTGMEAYDACSRCDYVSPHDVIPALGHDYDAVVTAPTCTAAGYTTHTCSRCHDSYVDSQTDALGHDIVHHDAVPADCTHTGMQAYDTCSRCDYETSHTVIPALGHDYDEVVTAPTCTEQGYTTHTCSRCHDSYVDSQTDALGHDIVHHDAVPATCTSDGMEAYDTCSRCDYETPHAAVPAPGHSWGATYEWSADGTSCTIHLKCARDQSHTHDITDVHIDSSVKTAATSSSMGVTSYTVSATYEGQDYSDSMDLTNIPVLEPEIKEQQVNGEKVYTNTVTENQPTQVTELFNTAKTNSGAVEVSVSTSASETPMTISFDSNAVSAIAGKAVILEAKVKTSSSEVADAEMVIEVNLMGATFSDGKAKVSVPFTETVPDGKTVKVYFINGSERQDMNATLVDGKVVFETNHFSTYAIVFEDAPSSSSNGGGFPIWIIFVIIAVVAVGGGAFFFISKKKA